MSGANWAADLGRFESADLRAVNRWLSRRRRTRGGWPRRIGSAVRWAILGGL